MPTGISQPCFPGATVLPGATGIEPMPYEDSDRDVDRRSLDLTMGCGLMGEAAGARVASGAG